MSVDGRRRRYVPMDVHLAFGQFGTRLIAKWGMDGLCTWMLFLAACKREPVEGTFTYTTDEEAWRKLGAEPSGDLTLDVFWRFTGQQKKTSRRTHGRVSYVSCTRWETWNTPRLPPQNPRKWPQNTEEIPNKYGGNAPTEVEVEGEGEGEDETTPTAPAPRLRPVDPVWDFVVSIEGEPLDRYRKARGRIVADLRGLTDDVDELGRRHDALAREWGDAKATARALVQNWHRAGQMADGLMRGPQRTDGRVSADELYESAVRRHITRSPLEPEGRLELEAG